MTTGFQQPGHIVTLTAPSGGVVSGKTYKIGSFIVVAENTVAEGEAFPAVTCGVHVLDKETGTAWSEGDVLYWDNTNKVWTKTSTSNTKAGLAPAAAASGDTTGAVFLAQLA